MWRTTVWTLMLALAAMLMVAPRAMACVDPEDAMKWLGASDPATVARGVTMFRDLGPEGLALALKLYDAHPSPAVAAAIDAVAGQKDALTSRLFWYTDLEAAKAAAKAKTSRFFRCACWAS